MDFALLKTAEPLVDYTLTAGGLEQQKRDRLAMIMKLVPISALVGGGLGGLASLSRINQTNQPAVDMEADPILLGPNVHRKRPFLGPPTGTKYASLSDKLVSALTQYSQPAVDGGKAVVGALGRGLSAVNPFGGSAAKVQAPPTPPSLFDTVAKNFMPSEQHAQPHTGIYGPSLIAASTLIPGYLAYKATRGIGQDVAEDNDDADVAAAEQEFQKARALQYRHMMMSKQADHVFDAAMNKTAMIKAADPIGLAELPYVNSFGAAASPVTGLPPHEAWRTLLGMGLMTAGVGGTAAAISGYNHATSKTPQQIAQMILDKRQQQLAKKPYSPTPELVAASAD